MPNVVVYADSRKIPAASERVLLKAGKGHPERSLPIAQLVNLIALLAAWVTVFDTIAKEREMLERPEQDVYGTMEQGAAAPAVVCTPCQLCRPGISAAALSSLAQPTLPSPSTQPLSPTQGV